jgi:hypothetical protein
MGGEGSTHGQEVLRGLFVGFHAIIRLAGPRLTTQLLTGWHVFKPRTEAGT